MIEDAEDPATTPERKDEPVTIIQAVTEYLADAKARELSDATVYKVARSQLPVFKVRRM